MKPNNQNQWEIKVLLTWKYVIPITSIVKYIKIVVDIAYLHMYVFENAHIWECIVCILKILSCVRKFKIYHIFTL